MELIVVIGIVGILALVGGPRLMDHMINMKVKAAARDIYSVLQQAKLEAVKENETVAVKFSPGTFSPDGAVGSCILFVDNGAGGGTADNLDKDGNEALLMMISMPKKVSLISASFSGLPKVGFTGQGLPFNSSSGNIKIRTSDRWYRINLSVAGNINMQKSIDGVNWS